MSQYPPQSYPPPGSHGGNMRPHRGAMILVLGILSLLLPCLNLILAIVAWVMANGDLREMDAGRMDPSGRGLTSAGKILGIVSICLSVVGFVVWALVVGLAMLAAAAGSAGP